MDDQGELSLLVDSNGGILLICSKCKKTWSGQFNLEETALSRGPLSVSKTLFMAAKGNSSLLTKAGISSEVLKAISSMHRID
ncbi:MAG: hypothetical protein WD751_07900 [Anaerolineales bacterium]